MPERIAEDLWQFTARHPDWTEDEGGAEEGWEPDVAWWALAAPEGLMLVDPLIDDWQAFDDFVGRHGGCIGIVRTCHWHQRSVPQARERYDVPVWAAAAPDGAVHHPCDRILIDGTRAPGTIEATRVERVDEVALWFEAQSALVFGDAMVRAAEGALRVCPESWSQPAGGRGELLAHLRGLARHRPRHVLVSHGPLVLDDGAAALTRALG